jgi:hypothetical protein
VASEAKTKVTRASVAAFLATVTPPQRRADCKVVAAMMRAASGAAPQMWGPSIVGFGRYSYTYASGRSGDWPIVAFSPRKQDLIIYLTPGFERLRALLAKLGKHRTGKVCLYLKSLSDVDQTVLRELIDKSVAAMAAKRVDKLSGAATADQRTRKRNASRGNSRTAKAGRTRSS